MPLTEDEELEYLRLKKAKWQAYQNKDNPPPIPGKTDDGTPPDGSPYELSDVAGALYQKAKNAVSYAVNNPNDAMEKINNHADQIVSDVVNNPGDAAMSAASGIVRAVPQGVDLAGALLAKGANYAGQKAGVTGNVPFSQYVQASPLDSALTAVIGSEYQPKTEGGQAVKLAAGLISPAGYMKGGSAVIKGAGTAAKGIDKSVGLGVDAVKGGYNAIAGRSADDVLKDIIDQSGLTPQQILDKIQENRVSGIADVAGDTVQGLTRSVAKTTGGKDVIASMLEKRAEGSSQRIANDLDTNVTTNNKYFDTLDDLKKKRNEQAAPLYNEAYSKNKAVQSPEIDRILDTPAGKSALANAVTRMRNDQSLVGIPDAELNEQAKLVGLKLEGGVASGLNLRTLDYVKRELDSQIGKAFRDGDNNLGGILNGLKNKLTSELDKADVTAKAGPNSFKPEGGSYAQARKVSSDSFKLEEAQKLGRDFDSATMRPAQMSRMLGEMTDAEREAYKIGVRERAQQIVERNSDKLDVSKSLFGNAERRARIQAILGPKEYSAFEKRMLEEKNLAKTSQRVLGGSRTDFNIDADQGAAEFFEDVLSSGIKGALHKQVLRKVSSFMSTRFKGINEKNAQNIARALLDREEGIKALERIYANQINKSGPTAKAAQQAIQSIKSVKNNAPMQPARIPPAKTNP